MSKNIPVLSVVIAIIILIRYIFDSNEKLLYIVAGINIVAIVFVLYTIVEKTINKINKKIKESNVPEQIIKRELKNTQFKIWGWSILVITILISVYFRCWCSSLGNDIISILALGISILDDEIVKKIVDNYKITR